MFFTFQFLYLAQTGWEVGPLGGSGASLAIGTSLGDRHPPDTPEAHGPFHCAGPLEGEGGG